MWGRVKLGTTRPWELTNWPSQVTSWGLVKTSKPVPFRIPKKMQKLVESIYQWEFQDPKLEVPTIYKESGESGFSPSSRVVPSGDGSKPVPKNNRGWVDPLNCHLFNLACEQNVQVTVVKLPGSISTCKFPDKNCRMGVFQNGASFDQVTGCHWSLWSLFFSLPNYFWDLENG